MDPKRQEIGNLSQCSIVNVQHEECKLHWNSIVAIQFDKASALIRFNNTHKQINTQFNLYKKKQQKNTRCFVNKAKNSMLTNNIIYFVNDISHFCSNQF